MQEEPHQQTTQFQQAIADSDNSIQYNQYEEVSLKVSYEQKTGKSNGITFIAKSNEEVEYPYVSTC